MKAAKASTTQVDGVTGATFSSKAVKENVNRINKTKECAPTNAVKILIAPDSPL